MKSRYALPVFFLTVAIFWLSLLLSSDVTIVAEPYDRISVSYKELEGIDSLELIRSQENPNYYSPTMYIRYADQSHITVTINNIKSPETAIKHIFIHQGNRLLLQPYIHQSLSKKTENKDYLTDSKKWHIDEIILPKQITQLHTRSIGLNITSREISKLPKLHIKTEGASIDIGNIKIESLSINYQYNKTSCTGENDRSYRSGPIKMETHANVDTLFIEGIYSHIDLNNSASIQSLHLKTTPETSVELDRLDIYPRMRWEPLPTPPLPECQEGAERMAAPPAMKAQ